MEKEQKFKNTLINPGLAQATNKSNIMVQTDGFRSLMHLDIPEIKQIGQEMLTSKPWSPPIGPNKTRYQGTPPKAAKTQSRVTNNTNNTNKKTKSISLSDISDFLKTLNI